MLQPLNVPIFPGQGTSAVGTPHTREQALQNASSPPGSLLLSSCWEAFHDEFKSLSSSDQLEVAIDLDDFKTPSTLLTVPFPQYALNPLVSGINLLLIQTLTYQAALTNTSTFLSSQNSAKQTLGVFGLSSGSLSACVVATSSTVLEYIANTVAAFRLAFWIGVRTQKYRRTSLQAAGLPVGDARPWSLVLSGVGQFEASDALATFSATHQDLPPLYLTAVMAESSVTISGRPDVLDVFAREAPASMIMHKTSLNTLYHTEVHAGATRNAVLEDIVRRNIRFPTFNDVKVPIWSTYTGQPIDQQASMSLVAAIVDMILTQPIHWYQVMQSLVTASGQHDVRLVNVGPGSGLAKSVKRAFPQESVLMLDLTVSQKPLAVNSASYPIQVPVAIVGMAVNMPGAPDVAKLWQVLEKGMNTISEIPEHRFKVSDYRDPASTSAGRSMNAHTGNFIDCPDAFDHKFFKISPREARSMDPQARVLLHTAYEALEDSGYVPGATPSFQPEMFGCYVGVATGDYVQNLRNDVDVYYSTGTLRAFLSGRISYAMRLGGPSVVVDTACSSSLVAIYQACRALMNHDCNAALAGGVNIITSPDMFVGLDRGHFLSPTGQCKAFDASADGYSRSEGCGLFVLKRLDDAVEEHDNILGIIRGVEVNQSGLAHSITHPHPPTQMALFKQILERTGIDAHRVSVVEAHGTGTQAGDPNELESIRGVFAVRRAKGNPLHITSVKANIGHLEAASGSAGLAKLLLMLKHQMIPRQISLKELNPRIADLALDNTLIDTDHVPWLSSTKEPRIALLNNFGAAGSNGALLLEEHIPTNSTRALETPASSFVIGLSAKTDEALSKLQTRFLDWLRNPENATASLPDIAYTSTARRIVYDHRLALTASSKDEAIHKLSAASGTAVAASTRKIAFVFSGQGSQYRGMGASFYRTIPLFREIVDECHSFLTTSGFPGVLQAIIPENMPGDMSQEEEFEVYQPAIFTLEYALARVWMSWGLSPVVVVGHSLGEYAAHVVAGVLSLKGALTLIANRVRFMVSQCPVNTTGMIAINRSPDVVQSILTSLSSLSEISIACYNSHSDCVVAGPLKQLHILKTHLDAEVQCKNALLSVPFGYHSPAMQPFLSDLIEVGNRVTIQPPTIPVVSNSSGKVIHPGTQGVFNPEYYARHCSEPVQFLKGMTALLQTTGLEDIDVWIEIGPHPSTLPMIKVHPLLAKGSKLLASAKKHQDGWTTMASTLAQLYTTQVDVKWRKVFSHLPSIACIPLPAYPWSRSKFWVPFKENAHGLSPSQLPPSHLISEYSMLHAWVQYPSETNGQTAIFETPIARLAKSILGHKVGDHPLCPASVYHELALSGVQLTAKQLGLKFKDTFVALGSIDYAKPLVYRDAVSCSVWTSITLNTNGSGSWKVSSQVDSSPENDNCVGLFRFQPLATTTTKFTQVQPVVLRQIAAVIAHGDAETFSTRTAYEIIFPRVVDYAKEYHTMKTLTVSPDGMEGYSIIQLPQNHDQSPFVVHPVFMDTLLHVAGFVANMQGGIKDAFICSKVDSVKVIPELFDAHASYGVYISNAWLADERVMLAEAYAVDLGASRKVVAHLKGMHFRKVQLSSLKRSLASSNGQSQREPQQLQPSLRRTFTGHPTTPSAVPTSQTLPRKVTSEVVRIVAETCDISPAVLDVDADLEAHGVDSLLSIELLHKLAAAFPNAGFNSQALNACRTVGDIIRGVAINSSPPTVPFDVPSPDICPSETSTAAVDEAMEVKNVLALALGVDIDEITDDADFEALGLDSLTAIEAHAALQKVFDLVLPTDIFVSHKTPGDIRAYISSQSPALSPVVLSTGPGLQPLHRHQISQPVLDRMTTTFQLDSIPVSIQPSSDRTHAPLFLIHDGGGVINYLTRLPLICRSLWGFNNPKLLSGQPWDSLSAMAKEYGEHVKKTATGPVILGGWSFGGVVAFEAARQLMRSGVDVTGVVLIDSPSPVDHVPLSDDLLDTVARVEGRSSSSDLGLLVKMQFQMNARLLGEYDGRKGGGPYPPLVLLRSRDGYNPVGVPDIPAWLADRRDPKQATLGWESLVSSPVKVIDIPGHHFSPFHTLNVDSVSNAIRDGCDYLESAVLRGT
ncbi:beta-ketoacyl synthase [Amylostereum chailletii]|nr:beta-ketoacyl synthase [Amylostereum chailletii]